MQPQEQTPIVDELTSIIRQLYAKYADDEFMRGKLVAHVAHLPTVLDAANQLRNDKEQRRQTLVTASDEFTEAFLNESPHYYYNPNVELFFVYNPDAERNYSVINEDDILHPIFDQNQQQPRTHAVEIQNKEPSAAPH